MQLDDAFLNAMGLEGLDDESKQKAMDDILFTLNINVAHRVMDSLNEQQLAQLDQLMSPQEPDTDQLSAWLQANVPTFDQLIGEEAAKMKQQTDEVLNKVFEKSS